MRKKVQYKTISLGSEPDIPDISMMKDFVSSYKGTESDLLTFQLLRSFNAQKTGLIDEIAVGGRYYRSRIENALSWDDEQGPSLDPAEVIRDYSLITKNSSTVRSVHESPSALLSSPSPEDEDAFAEMCHGFRQLLRFLRDHRIAGHIIHLTNPTSLELELLGGSKHLFYLHEPDSGSIEELLEYSQDLILPAEHVSLISDMVEQYPIHTLTLCDATEYALHEAMQYLDPDHLKVAGYCSGPEEEYWKKIKDSAVISL